MPRRAARVDGCRHRRLGRTIGIEKLYPRPSRRLMPLTQSRQRHRFSAGVNPSQSAEIAQAEPGKILDQQLPIGRSQIGDGDPMVQYLLLEGGAIP